MTRGCRSRELHELSIKVLLLLSGSLLLLFPYPGACCFHRESDSFDLLRLALHRTMLAPTAEGFHYDLSRMLNRVVDVAGEHTIE